MPRYVHTQGLPANEGLEHFTLKWAAYHLLTAELACPFALVEAGARIGATGGRRWPRHDALGVRFRAGRAQAGWVELAATAVRLEVLDGRTGRWRAVAAGELDGPVGQDPTLRAFERQEQGETPLRAAAAGTRAGTVRVRRSGGERRELAQLCGADAKASRADLQAWLQDAPRRLRGVQLFVIVTPPGLCRPAELPDRVGLAEVDLEALVDPAGLPAIRIVRQPEVLRPAAAWPAERTAEFQRHCYYAMHGLFGRRLFWLLAQQARDRQRAATRPRRTAPARDGSGGVVVRAYRPADGPAVVGLWEAAGITRPWNDPLAEIARHRASHRDLLLVATDGAGAPVGVVMGGWDGRRGWVHHLAVAVHRRREGVARSLLAEVEERLRALGCPKVQLLVRNGNAAADAFYHRVGYAAEDVHCLSKWLVAPPGAAQAVARD